MSEMRSDLKQRSPVVKSFVCEKTHTCVYKALELHGNTQLSEPNLPVSLYQAQLYTSLGRFLLKEL